MVRLVIAVVDQIADGLAADYVDVAPRGANRVAEGVGRAVAQRKALAVAPDRGVEVVFPGHQLLSGGVEDVRHGGCGGIPSSDPGYGHGLPSGECEVDVVLVHVDLDSRGILSVFAGRLSELRPRGAVVVGDVPIILLDPELRGDGVARYGEFLSVVAGEPFAVERPVVDAVGVFPDGDDGCRAGFAVVDDDGLPFGEFQRIADDGSVLGERFDRGDVIAVVECRDDGLHRPEIGVHVVAEPFEFSEPLLEVVHAFDEFRIVVRVVAAGQRQAQTGQKCE